MCFMCAFFQERKIYIFQERKKKIQHLRQNVREEHANKTYLAINLSCQVLDIQVYFDLFLFRARGKKLVVIEGYSRIKKKKKKKKRDTHKKATWLSLTAGLCGCLFLFHYAYKSKLLWISLYIFLSIRREAFLSWQASRQLGTLMP